MLPAPTAPSEGYAGVRNLIRKTRRPPDPLSILAHQLRRRFRSNRSLVRGAKPIYQTARPEGSLVLRSVRPALNRSSRRKPSDFPRPFLGRPLSRSALLRDDPKTISKPRRAGGRSTLPAPLPGWPRLRSEEPWHCRPAEIGPLVTCRTVLPLRAFQRGRDRRPDHLSTMHPSPESQKRKIG